MKNIPPSVLPYFHGIAFEDLDAFLFLFDILCRTYGHTNDAHKLCLFLSTSMNTTLKWFMGLGENTIGNWKTMRNIFLNKYQAYYIPSYSKEYIFRMDQKEDQNLRDSLERFLYNLQKSKHSSLNLEVICPIFLKGIHDKFIDIINLMGLEDI
jgi:hypothetical protein